MKVFTTHFYVIFLGPKGKAGAKRKKMDDNNDGDDTGEKVSLLSHPKKSKGM